MSQLSFITNFVTFHDTITLSETIFRMGLFPSLLTRLALRTAAWPLPLSTGMTPVRSTLYFPPMSMLIPGVYTCSADNGVGQPDTASITLTVECKYQTFSLAFISLSLAIISLLLVFVSATESLFLVSHNLISSMSALCWVRPQHSDPPLFLIISEWDILLLCYFQIHRW